MSIHHETNWYMKNMFNCSQIIACTRTFKKGAEICSFRVEPCQKHKKTKSLDDRWFDLKIFNDSHRILNLIKSMCPTATSSTLLFHKIPNQYNMMLRTRVFCSS
uniref:Uncharacterized protein n=1 Tax=Clytia hemisphaerica TaxID=252671 RepID=A0A7M5UXC7_9CNID